MIKQLEIKETSQSFIWEGKELKFKSGKLATQSGGSVIVSLGDTELLVTAVFNGSPNEHNDFLPLTIDFREMYYAAGKIGGGPFNKREGRPSENAILNARLTDRPLRPMFPEGMVNDVVLTITTLSADRENMPGVLSIIGSSLAIMLAGIPFEGPVGAVRIGYKDGKYIVNPTKSDIDEGMLNLVIAGSKDTITMVECGAQEVPTDILMGAFKLAQQELGKVCDQQSKFLENFSPEQKEITVNKPCEELMAYISNFMPDDKLAPLYPSDKKKFNEIYHAFEDEILNTAQENIEDEENKTFTRSKIKMGIFKTMKKYIRKRILEKGERLDGRGLDDVRPLYCETGLMKRIHGQGLFQRGETQVLSTTTLGAPGDYEIIDTMELDEFERKFIHHYNMPPFSTNEARPVRFVSRREIGHGKLAEKSLLPMLPDNDKFPYTIRVVSDVLSCNGSTSMASVCATTLSLMDAGVPIKKPVSGIAMGLVSDENLNYQVLTDIQGLEDFTGDMDFKIAGTKDGITALQMDMKVKGLKLEILEEAIEKGNKGRLDILDFMLQTIDKPREDLNPFAPKVHTFKIKPEQVRDVIGPGGSVINEIIRQSGVKIDFEDDGTGMITSKDSKGLEIAMKLINEITWEPKAGDTMEGKIIRVESYGVFVNVGGNKSGLCHVKQLGEGYISDPKTMFKVGDKMKVTITEIDKEGRLNLKKVG